MTPDAAIAALASTPRLLLLKRLVRAGPAGMNASAIAKAIGASPPRTSFHLATLTEAGLSEGTRHSRQVVYRARYDALGTLVHSLLHDCCADYPEVLACSSPGATSKPNKKAEQPGQATT